MFLRALEERYNLVDEDRRSYFSKTIFARNLDLKELKDDKQLFSVIYQKYVMNMTMENIYRNLLQEQYEIKELIESELKNTCYN